MAATLPIKTTADDVEKLFGFVGSKPGWVEVESVKNNLGTTGDTRKINTLHFLGIIERDGTNVKLTAAGRDISMATGESRTALFAGRLKATALYNDTLEWMHWQGLENPTKVHVAAQWIETAGPGIADGAPEGLITDGAICFFRMAEYGGLGKFVSAGGTREARFDVDKQHLKSLVTGEIAPDPKDTPPKDSPPGNGGSVTRTGGEDANGRSGSITLDPGVRLNIEIHIAADATPETIEEIFKNMRIYVLNDPESEAESG